MLDTTPHNVGLVASAAPSRVRVRSTGSTYAPCAGRMPFAAAWPTVDTAAELPTAAFRRIGHKPGTRRLEEHPT